MSIPSRHSSPSRIQEAERTFFVSTSASEQRHYLQSYRMAELLIATMLDYRDQGRFLLHAFVVMPTHLHVLLTVLEGMTIEKATQYIKGGFSHQAREAFGFPFKIWRDGFSESRMFSARHFEASRLYIHQNPVKKHLSQTPEEFPFSSATGKFKVDPLPNHLRG